MLFAEREYEVEGLETKLVLQINEPRTVDGHWICEHRLVGMDPDYAEFSATGGVDKLQAVTLALQRIAADLESLQYETGRRITIMGDPRIDLI